MGIIDIIIFFGFIAAVLCVGMMKSKGEQTSGEKGADEYFLAGRGLKWWLIGFSLIAANISAEQFVGMSGQGAGLEGLSCASWEWIAAIALVVVAFALLPYFLKTGITTIPEFLEVRYNHWARTIMTVSMMGILIIASLIGVTYAGSLVMHQLFLKIGWNIPFWGCCLLMGLMAGGYVLFGGLKACAWADLLQGSALIVGGAIIAYFAVKALGSAETVMGWTRDANGVLQSAPQAASGDGWLATFKAANAVKLEMGRPASDTAMPWTILLVGIWIPNFYYWGLNQYITQRILGSGSLAEGQKGLVLASALKLLIPFIIVIPGIIAFNLFAKDMVVADGSYKYDSALGLLITKLIPQNVGILGFVLAALLGAIVSSLAAVLNATSTLLTMDIYQRYIKRDASPKQLVSFGRISIAVLMVIGIVVASMLKAESIFAYIQTVQLYISGGVVAVFIFGLLNRRGARWVGVVGLLVYPLIFAFFNNWMPASLLSAIPLTLGGSVAKMHYLWAASYALILTLVVMFVLGAVCKEEKPVTFESNTKLDLTTSKGALVFGLAVIALTVALYVVFW
ncbi:MAG: sodium/solute symporter [Kiritimatiellae bacterium]|nr:sodium/solute symporter [Kiritimatiellia bacterium]